MLKVVKATLLGICLYGVLHTDIKAQQTLFTQFDRAYFMANPAWVAVGNQMRASAIYRNQHYGNGLHLNTSTLDLMHPFTKTESGKTFAGVGLSAMHDQAQGEVTYGYTRIAASLAYAVHLGANHQLSLGIQPAFSQKSLNFEGFTTGSQWIPNYGFDPGASQGEAFGVQNAFLFRFSSGLLWHYSEQPNQPWKYYAGISAFNLNRPTEVFIEQEVSPLAIRYMAMAGAYLMPVGKWNLFAEGLYQQVENNRVGGLGPVLSYTFVDDNPFNPITSGELKLFARYWSSKTISAGIRLAQKHYDIGFSYDLNLNRAQALGAYEISLSVFKPIGHRKKTTISTSITDDTYTLGQVREFITEQDREVPRQTQNDAIQKESPQRQKEEKPVRFELRKDFKFGFNEIELDEEAQLYLQDIASLLLVNEALKMKIIGHTDNIGSSRANKRISYERAMTVRDYLISIGIPEERLSVVGMSDEQPLYPNDTDTNRAKNRRVEFIIYSGEE